MARDYLSDATKGKLNGLTLSSGPDTAAKLFNVSLSSLPSGYSADLFPIRRYTKACAACWTPPSMTSSATGSRSERKLYSNHRGEMIFCLTVKQRILGDAFLIPRESKIGQHVDVVIGSCSIGLAVVKLHGKHRQFLARPISRGTVADGKQNVRC